MNELNLSRPADVRRYSPIVLLLFVGSGCAALIYEIVWFQLLGLVIGSSAISLGVLLGTYMGGMCLGSLLLSRVVSARANPLRVYALLEIGIGVCGVIVLFLVPMVTQAYAANVVGRGMGGIMLRGVVCAICLLPPTLLMGATLPAVARWVEATPRGVSWLGFFYGGNIAGAVFGSLLAGFYLLRVHDMATATYVAAAINIAVAVIAYLTAPRVGFAPQSSQEESDKAHGVRGSSWVYVTIALSGLCALGAEVVWTRLLSLLLGATVYTFSIILAVFLVGLGIGSSMGSMLARQSANPRTALGICQFLLTAGIAWTAYMLAKSLPFWPINAAMVTSPWVSFQLDLARCFWAVLPPAILWGASFPLALAAVVSAGQDSGKLVGKVYAANTVGAIIGAVGVSALMIGWLGTQESQQLLIAIAGLAALLALASSLFTSSRTTSRVGICTGLVLVVGVTALLVRNVPPLPWKLVAHGRYMPTYNSEMRNLLYLGEGLSSSVAVTETLDGVRSFHVSGKVEASSDPEDMRLQRMLGHIPAVLMPEARSVLIVGCGAGVTAGSFTTYTNIQRIVICDIEKLIPQKVAPYFSSENYNVVNDPRVEIIHDDARHFILTTKEKFDIITSDPIHPWVKGAAALYTREYFDMVKEHLNPGGLVTQWVPLYESNADVVRSEVATFFAAFPGGSIWGNEVNGGGYDVVMLGGKEPLPINVDAAQALMDAQPKIAESLREVGYHSAVDLFSHYAGSPTDLAPWLKDAEINRDRNLRLQYLAGMASNLYQEGNIYRDMLSYRKYPEQLFTGSDKTRQILRDAIR